MFATRIVTGNCLSPLPPGTTTSVTAMTSVSLIATTTLLTRADSEIPTTNRQVTAAMIATATRAGFVPEGTLRGSAWVDGAFADETILGLLAAEWVA